MLLDKVSRTLPDGRVGLGSTLRKAHYPAVAQALSDLVLRGAIKATLYVFALGPPRALYRNGPSHAKQPRQNPPFLHGLRGRYVVAAHPGRKQVKRRRNGIFVAPLDGAKDMIERNDVGKVGLVVGQKQ